MNCFMDVVDKSTALSVALQCHNVFTLPIYLFSFVSFHFHYHYFLPMLHSLLFLFDGRRSIFNAHSVAFALSHTHTVYNVCIPISNEFPFNLSHWIVCVAFCICIPIFAGIVDSSTRLSIVDGRSINVQFRWSVLGRACETYGTLVITNKISSWWR